MLTDISYKDISEVVNYLWHDEEEDYASHPDDHGKNIHIFECLQRIDAWLEDNRP
jgi:hypothetical protein